METYKKSNKNDARILSLSEIHSPLTFSVVSLNLAMMMLRQIVILLSLLSLSCNATNTLKGKHLKVAFSGLPPFVYTNKDGSYSGIDLNIIPILADKMGFSYTLEWGQFWGSQYPDGGWAGVVGYVKNGSHTIGLGHVLLQMGRFEAVDYALMYSQPHFLMAPRPKPIAPVWNMTRPFTPYVWLGALGTILAVTLFSLVIRPKKGKSTLTGWVLYIFGSQFNQQFRGKTSPIQSHTRKFDKVTT